jgi:hypothetical protein
MHLSIFATEQSHDFWFAISEGQGQRLRDTWAADHQPFPLRADFEAGGAGLSNER